MAKNSCDLCQKEIKGKSTSVLIENEGNPQKVVEDLDSVCQDCSEKILFFIENMRKPEKKKAHAKSRRK
jgi:ribosome-binding protein aMBF1 (putative translation factor)